ncbi:MAG: hypothetical protein AJITA_01111 [Acetilactobacillus jinshanensis]
MDQKQDLAKKLTKKDKERKYNIKQNRKKRLQVVNDLKSVIGDIHKILKIYSKLNDEDGDLSHHAKKQLRKEAHKELTVTEKGFESAERDTDDVLIRNRISNLEYNILQYKPNEVFAILDGLISDAQSEAESNLYIQTQFNPTEEAYNKDNLLVFVDTKWTHQKPEHFYNDDGVSYYAYYKKDKNHYVIKYATAREIISDKNFLFSEREKEMIDSRLQLNGSTLNTPSISLEEAQARFNEKVNFY